MSLDDLIDHHFRTFSDEDHINRVGLTVALRLLAERPAWIVETGTSAWGTDSSRLWSSYVNTFGGEFWTVDVRPEAGEALGDLGRHTHVIVGDSVDFLECFRLPDGVPKIDLLYLDSLDLDIRAPEAAMAHGLEEWWAARHLLGPGSIVVIDDTPVDPSFLGPDGIKYYQQTGRIPGKGALVLDELANAQCEILYNHYNLVVRMM